MGENPKVYLVKIVNEDKTLYKIGFTRGSVYKRIKELQTGCPYEILMVETFDTEYGTIIERTLHNAFSHRKTYGEWFELSSDEEFKFKEICEKYENIQNLLNKKQDY